MTLEQKYIDHVEDCFDKAINLQSKITDEVRDMDGMTGLMTRHFYNNLLSMVGARHLEIGVWKGSSTCAAMYGNQATVIAMDDFSGFGSPKEEFLLNFEKYKGENNATFIEADCFKFDISALRKFNIYLFDGDHSEASQEKAVEYYLPVMDDLFIMIVDDWNWKEVRSGTMNGINKNNLSVTWEKEIRLTDNDTYTVDPEQAKNTWWNGIALFILKQNQQ